MGTLRVERLGGFGGYGGAHLQSRGALTVEQLNEDDRTQIAALFDKAATQKAPGGSAMMRDGFTYRLSRDTEGGTETIDVPESAVPAAVIACVRDTIV